MAPDRMEASRVRRAIAFYLTGVVTFLVLAITGSVTGLGTGGSALSRYSTAGVAVSVGAAYYLVYRGGYERLRRLLS